MNDVEINVAVFMLDEVKRGEVPELLFHQSDGGCAGVRVEVFSHIKSILRKSSRKSFSGERREGGLSNSLMLVG
jgi:hypothetical protein